MEEVWVTVVVVLLRALVFVCDAVTLPVHVVLQQPWRRWARGRRRKAERGKDEAGEDGERPPALTVRSKTRPRDAHQRILAEGVDTLDKVLRSAARRHPQRPCLGTREVLAEEEEVRADGRVFKKLIMGEYRWLRAAEVEAQAEALSRGLRLLGAGPQEPVAIFAETRAEWTLVAHACFRTAVPVVTVYATLGADAVAHALNDTQVTMVVTSHELLPTLKPLLPSAPRVAIVVYMEDRILPPHADGVSNGVSNGVTVLPYRHLLTLGEGANSKENCGPQPDDTAIIMYTSGSTGVPKGVVLTHRNAITCIKGYADGIEFLSNDVFLGFLPLAHVYELLAESVCLFCGIPIGYSSPLTLIDTSSKIKEGTPGDMSVLKPTCITSVPLVLDRLSKGIREKLARGSPFQRALFNFSFEYKRVWLNWGFNTPLVNRLVFGGVRQLMGGRLRFIISGGAPLSPETHELVKICFCETVIQGYGLTETCSCATLMDPYDLKTGHVGAPVSVCTLKLVDWEEGNYRVTDRPFPRGEIVIGGDNVSPGYLKMPDKTKEDFFEEDGVRWFRTGDIGEVLEDGVVQVIDRKKDLVKLQHGEYVPLGRVEAELKTNPLVDNICVYGDPTKENTVALVVPNQERLERLSERLALKGLAFEELCKKPEVQTAVLRELTEYAKKCKLDKFEVPTAINLCTDAWLPDTGLVTPAFKLKRKDIHERYQLEIKRMYELCK